MDNLKKLLTQWSRKLSRSIHHLYSSIEEKIPFFKSDVHAKPISPLFVYGIIGITILVVFVITLPTILNDRALKKLGFSDTAIAGIRDQELVTVVKDNGLYTDTLNRVFENGITIDKTYYPLYTIKDVVDDKTILMYQRLVVKGYTQDEILTLLSSLQDYELTALLTFQKLDDIQAYIDDCKSHPENSYDSFVLTNTYAKVYDESSITPTNTSGIDMLVNKFNYLDSHYVPSDLGEVSIRYAASGVQLSQEAASALASMSDAYAALGYPNGFFVSSGYRDYASQESIYNSYVSANGQEAADAYATKPGFSEHQTGLALDLASTDTGKEFKDTNEFVWVSSNCMEYGFILRFPENKETITHIDYEPWHYRYVGVELAKKIYESKMTFDEYYELYLRVLPENILELIQANQKAALEQAKANPTASPTVEATIATETLAPTQATE